MFYGRDVHQNVPSIGTSKNTSVTLSDHFEIFVEAEVASGRFDNASKVVRAGLRMLEREEKVLQALRTAIDDGVNSGQPVNGTEAFARILVKNGLPGSSA